MSNLCSELELRNLYIEEKLNIKEISQKLNVSPSTVCKLMKKFGIPARERQSLEPLSKEQLIEMYVNQQMSMEEIAVKYNVHRVTISKWLKTCQIQIKDPNKPIEKPIKEELSKLYLEQFKTLNEIGEIYKVNRNLVSKWLGEYNIKIRMFGKVIEPPTKEIIEQLYLVEKSTMKQIAEIYQVDESVVRRWIFNFKIPSRSNKRKYYILKAIPLTLIQRDFVFGTMLGDGHLECVGKNKSVRLAIRHSIKQMDYFFWKKEIMGNFINTYQLYTQKERNSTTISGSTIFHNDFSFFHKLFYDNNKIKIIRDEIIHYLTPFAMAIWVMDDGYKNHNSNIRICTEGFTKKENEKLQNMIKINFNINCNVVEYERYNKKYYYLSFNKRNSELLTDLIEPFVIEQMKYKLIHRTSTTTR